MDNTKKKLRESIHGFRFISGLRKFPIRTRILFGFIMMLLVPILLIGILDYSFVSRSMTNKVRNYQKVMNEIQLNAIERNKLDIGKIAMSLSISKEIQDFLLKGNEYESYEKALKIEEINKIVYRETVFFEYIKNFCMYRIHTGEDGETDINIIYSLNYNPTGQNCYDDFKKIAPGETLWKDKITEKGISILMLRSFYLEDGGKSDTGVIVMELNSNFLNLAFGSTDEVNRLFNIVINESGEVITVPAWLKEGIDKNIIIDENQDVQASYMIEINDNQYETYSKPILDTGWRLVTLLGRDYLKDETRAILIILLIVSLSFAILSVFLAIILSISILAPMNQLAGYIDEVFAGDLKGRINDEGRDEVHSLINGFNRMVQQLNMAEAERVRFIHELQTKAIEMERFAYTVSHDLKSPLITIRGFSGAIKLDIEKGRFDRVSQDLDRISMATDKMQMLMEGLLSLSRIGRMVNLSSHFSMTELGEEVKETLHGLLLQKSMTLEIQPNMPVIRGDRQRIMEVIQNLVENACKFNDKESGIVTFGHRIVDGEGQFYVEDHGPGISPQYHEKIFGLFDRLEQKIEGSGIGLALVKRIVELHNGRIWVESQEGQGATFCFTIKQKEDES